MFLTFFELILVGKVMKENHIRKVRKNEERNVKNIGKDAYSLFYEALLSL